MPGPVNARPRRHRGLCWGSYGDRLGQSPLSAASYSYPGQPVSLLACFTSNTPILLFFRTFLAGFRLWRRATHRNGDQNAHAQAKTPQAFAAAALPSVASCSRSCRFSSSFSAWCCSTCGRRNPKCGDVRGVLHSCRINRSSCFAVVISFGVSHRSAGCPRFRCRQ